MAAIPLRSFPASDGHRILHGLLVLLGLSLFLTVCACRFTAQTYTDFEHTVISLGRTDLEDYGIGFLTPAAATGQETDKQALSLVFSNELADLRPNVRVVPLPAVLSAVNQNDLAAEYQQMYRDYLETGILEKSLLLRIGVANDVGFLAQLSLADFHQGQRGRFGFLGLRLVDTQKATIRVFLQIWDSRTGTVAWEGTEEANHSYDTSSERPVTFKAVAEIAARKLFERLPGAVSAED
jgi:hypothetical protein